MTEGEGKVLYFMLYLVARKRSLEVPFVRHKAYL
jgi:hypothetical protein